MKGFIWEPLCKRTRTARAKKTMIKLKVPLGVVGEYLRNYSPQLVATIFCSILFLFTEFKFVPRLENKQFRLDNKSIGKTHVNDELISGVEVISMSAVISGVIVTWFCTQGSDSLRKFHGNWMNMKPERVSSGGHFFVVSVLCLMLTLSLNGAITGCLKLVIGNFRPDFIDRCKPNMEKAQDLSAYYGLDICEQPNKWLLYEGLKSTPSGHSSFITSGLGFAYYWQKKYVSSHYSRHLWCIVLIILVMISRITDHRHHWYDVVSGCLLGITVIAISWRWVYGSRSMGYQLPA